MNFLISKYARSLIVFFGGCNMLFAQAPGSLDGSFVNFQTIPQITTILNTEPKFLGAPDIRTAVVQPDGKVVIGGNFIIQQEFVRFTIGNAATVHWKNIARFNADGTLDQSFISTSAAQLANSGLYTTANPFVWGTDQPIYSIGVELLEDSYQYIVVGDFLNFSHNDAGVDVPRSRYLVLSALFPESDLEVTIPRLQLSAERSENFSFDSAVRKIKLLDSPRPEVDLVVANAAERTALTLEEAPVGFIVLDADTNRSFLRRGQPIIPEWELLDPEERGSYFFMGDFNVYDNQSTPHIVKVSRTGNTLELAQDWFLNEAPNARVNDVAVFPDNNIIVGDFTLLGGNLSNRIAAIDNSGGFVGTFNPGGSGFDNRANTVGQQVRTTSVIVGGDFQSYNGDPANYLVRLNLVGARDFSFPAPNFGNSNGPNGPVATIAVQPDGRVLIAGSFTSYNGIPRSGIARIEPDGSLDTTFTPTGNASGVVTFATDVFSGFTNASLINSPVVVGNFRNFLGRGYEGIARLRGGSFPVIWYQPQVASSNLNVNVGDFSTLRVVATDNFRAFPGNPAPPMPYFSPFQPSEPLLYQWFKNGSRIPGAVNPELNLGPVSPKDSGNYTVRVYNSRYSIRSQAGRLNVLNVFQGVIGRRGFRIEGRIDPNDGLNSGLGGQLRLRVNRTGAISGNINMQDPDTGRSARHRVSGQMNSSGFAQMMVQRRNKPPLYLTLQFDTTQGPDYFSLVQVASTISDGSHTAEISGWSNPWSRNNPATQWVGRYHVGLAVDPVDRDEMINSGVVVRPKTPQGEGYLIMNITTTGQARISGLLPDGTRVTMRGDLSNDADPALTVWRGLYRNAGVLQGLITIQNAVDNPVFVEFDWSKPAGLRNTTDSFGFTNVVVNEVVGSGLFSRPALESAFSLSGGNFEMTFDDGNWLFTNGGLPAPPIVQLFNYDGRRATPIGLNPNSVNARVNVSSGVFSGTFVALDQYGASRRVRYSSIALTAGIPPEIVGYFVMPATPRRPEFFIGGEASGAIN